MTKICAGALQRFLLFRRKYILVKIKRGTFSRCRFRYCPMRKWDQMTIGIFLMVISPEFRMGQYRLYCIDDDRRMHPTLPNWLYFLDVSKIIFTLPRHFELFSSLVCIYYLYKSVVPIWHLQSSDYHCVLTRSQ